MEVDKFMQLAEKRIGACRLLLAGSKNEEYTRDGDKFHNFRVAAALDGETPEQALWGMWKKHIVSVRDMVHDIEAGRIPTEKTIDDKMTDMINYTLLMEGLIEERRKEKGDA